MLNHLQLSIETVGKYNGTELEVEYKEKTLGWPVCTKAPTIGTRLGERK
jgi:hypothetical protein